MELESSKPEPESLIRLSSRLLSFRDFSSSRKYALMAQEFDPNLPGTDQIIAIANVLLAAEHRLPKNHIDYYSVLQVSSAESDAQPVVRTQFKKLVTLLNPSKNKLPFSQDALKLVYEAWSVLSDPEKKTHYDTEISKCNIKLQKCGQKAGAGSQNQPKNGPETKFQFDNEEKQKEGLENENGTFWTVCPYCYCVYEYEKVYEECCLRCQNCMKAFHGVAVPPLQQSVMVEGREEYYCALGYFRFGYSRVDFLNDNEGYGGDDKGKMDDVVEISDNDDDDEKSMNEKNSGEINVNGKEAKEEVVKGVGEEIEGKENVGVAVGVNVVQGRYNGKRVKSVARNTKKIMGRGMKSRKTESMSSQRMEGEGVNLEFEKGNRSEGELEFFDGDDDIFVCVKDAF